MPFCTLFHKCPQPASSAEFRCALEVENGIEGCITCFNVFAATKLLCIEVKVAGDVEGSISMRLKDVDNHAGNEEAVILWCRDLRAGHWKQQLVQATWWRYWQKDMLQPLIHVMVMTRWAYNGVHAYVYAPWGECSVWGQGDQSFEVWHVQREGENRVTACRWDHMQRDTLWASAKGCMMSTGAVYQKHRHMDRRMSSGQSIVDSEQSEGNALQFATIITNWHIIHEAILMDQKDKKQQLVAKHKDQQIPAFTAWYISQHRNLVKRRLSAQS
ncbi:hypothetical protein IW261DRAFT_1422939 [Armillaria novae-zelandiae]|uniref:Uncharacterized protein n=1 Tax=Armillaria novae-zelandiae TaxID=153914 RepID=A0AA39NZE2_9AGAR|nr:hypothetical protein IW261DRAFT_1422939 [Armillaria novae-zelandiae]